MKKTSVPTWKLLMSAMNLLPEDLFSKKELEKVDLLYQDLLKKAPAAEIIRQECPELEPALQKLQNWQTEEKVTLLEHRRIKDEIMAVIERQQLPETVKIPAVRSLWSFWGLIAELDCIPGRPLKDIIAMFRQDYSGIPEHLLATVVCRVYEDIPLTQSAFEIRDWCRNTPRPEKDIDTIKWNIKFGIAAENIRHKYNLPEYLE